jgi:hypothetical protein
VRLRGMSPGNSRARSTGRIRIRLAPWLAVGLLACAGSAPATRSDAVTSAGGGTLSLTVYAMARPGQQNLRPGPAGVSCPQWLVLAPDRQPPSYTSDELRQMGNYFAGDRAHDPPAGLLQLLPGGLIDDPAVAAPLFTEWSDPTCSVFLQITNKGRTAVQIPQVGLEVTHAPQPNALAYRLPEICSLEETSAWTTARKRERPTRWLSASSSVVAEWPYG